MKHNRTYNRLGQSKAKEIALKDISEFCKESDLYTKNYVMQEYAIWQCLKLFNPIVLTINTNLL